MVWSLPVLGILFLILFSTYHCKMLLSVHSLVLLSIILFKTYFYKWCGQSLLWFFTYTHKHIPLPMVWPVSLLVLLSPILFNTYLYQWCGQSLHRCISPLFYSIIPLSAVWTFTLLVLFSLILFNKYLCEWCGQSLCWLVWLSKMYISKWCGQSLYLCFSSSPSGTTYKSFAWDICCAHGIISRAHEI